MRVWKTVFSAAVVLVGAVSCGSVPRYVNTSHRPMTVITVWVDQRAGLPLADAIVGCNLWNEEDVRCVAVPSPLEADVIVVLDPHPCAPDKDDQAVLATASPTNVINVRLDCFYDLLGEFDAKEYRLVLAHEFGHEFGIWDHVPKRCDGKSKDPVKTLPDGQRVCGVAIMNPQYDDSVKYLTPNDDRAFRARDDRTYNVLRRSPADTGKSCTYEKKFR